LFLVTVVQFHLRNDLFYEIHGIPRQSLMIRIVFLLTEKLADKLALSALQLKVQIQFQVC
jgi:hypothetical protein